MILGVIVGFLAALWTGFAASAFVPMGWFYVPTVATVTVCLSYTSDAADE